MLVYYDGKVWRDNSGRTYKKLRKPKYNLLMQKKTISTGGETKTLYCKQIAMIVDSIEVREEPMYTFDLGKGQTLNLWESQIYYAED